MSWPTRQVASIKPGDLTTAHAQILASTIETDRCTSCHEPNLISRIAVNADPVVNEAHRKTQSQRCLDCHHSTMPRPSAMMAHNILRSHRESIRLASTSTSSRMDWHDWRPKAVVDQESIHCGVCHQEHHGADHDLRFVSDTQCQTCHQNRFDRFSGGHPDFGDWPYDRPASFSFNHATHAGKHFPNSKSKEAFTCVRCHDVNPIGEISRVSSYEVACASCHDEGLKLESAEGLDLVALPMLETSLAEILQSWPERAVGFNDGRVPPLTRLLIRNDPKIASLLKVLPNSDFSTIDPNSPEAVEMGIALARAIENLFAEIGVDGQAALTQRLMNSKTAARTDASKDLFRSFPPQIVGDAIRRWWSPESEIARNRLPSQPVFRSVQHRKDDFLLADDEEDDLLSDPTDELLEADDALLESSLGEPSPKSPKSPDPRFDADRVLPQGGWYRDDVRLAIRYRGGGHADPVLIKTIELAASLPTNDSVRTEILSSRFAKACLGCHQGINGLRPTESVQWKASPWVGRLDQFTKFAHGPHLKIASLADCQGCHKIAELSAVEQSLNRSLSTVTSSNGQPFCPSETLEFEPITKGMCVQCHRAKAAGETCMSCHRYHLRQEQAQDQLSGDAR